MNRRHFLVSSAVSALALMFPLQALAAKPMFDYSDVPVHELELIEQAMDVGEVYKFSLPEKTSLFGIEPSAVSNLGGLRDFVQEFALDYGSRDLRNRVRFLIAIRKKLDERFGRNNINAQLAWINGHEPLLGCSVRDLMNAQHYMELYRVVQFMGCEAETV